MIPATDTTATVPRTTPTAAAIAETVAESRAAILREERLLLLLSIFIGVISGLLVVSFRMAIDWLCCIPRRNRTRRV
jgi:CIC family chloride channel protein